MPLLPFTSYFKFQSDSINTWYNPCIMRGYITLNSNLILLIHIISQAVNLTGFAFKFQSDSINTIVLPGQPIL